MRGKKPGVRVLPAPHLPYSWYNFAEFFPYALISFSEDGKDLEQMRGTNYKKSL